jgi:hypothetical protein
MYMKVLGHLNTVQKKIEGIPLCIKTPQYFQNYLTWQVRSPFCVIEVHANNIPLKINKGPSNSSL